MKHVEDTKTDINEKVEQRGSDGPVKQTET